MSWGRTDFGWGLEGPGFYGPRYNSGGMVTLNSSVGDTVSQSGTQWSVTTDATASNTPPLAFALLWPLLDINGKAVPAGPNWNIPRMWLDVITPPGETSNLWVAVGVTGGPDFSGQYSGGGAHYDAAGGPDNRRFDQTTGPTDTAPIASTGVVIATSTTPHHTVPNATRNTRVCLQPIDSSGDPINAPLVLNGGSAIALAPHFFICVGNSTGAAATVVFNAGYERCNPTDALVVR